ncbi:MAG: large conductance mechanosensitive channel protein MscL [Planctomycetes bacterium]|nr:large conductance mechanosensitive channel protein MscL [Planctomycetota bacterium]MBI3843598.1 large conductance mechanosensitive channel protein MscL [Planctomycetota bacterium]
MFKGFKEFVMRGNVMDLAVGIIIGAAFGKIVSSFVGDVLTPLLGLVLGKVDFTHMYVSLTGGTYATLEEARKAGPVLTYGNFLQAVFDFLIVAFAIFIVIQQVNKLKHAPVPVPAGPPTTKTCNFCASTIPIKATRCPNCTSQLPSA